MLVCSVDNFRLVRINKPANLCVVVSRIEVVEAALGVIVVTAIAERVVRAEGGREGAGHGKNVAPRVVRIFYHDFARGGQNCENISAEVLAEIIVFAAVNYSENACGFRSECFRSLCPVPPKRRDGTILIKSVTDYCKYSAIIISIKLNACCTIFNGEPIFRFFLAFCKRVFVSNPRRSFC